MNPDDPRHGTWAGYIAGCRTCCGEAARRYQAGRTYDAHRGLPRTLDPHGLRRRVEALACLGWSGQDIASRLGHGHEWLRQVLRGQRVYRRTHEQIVAVYDELVTLPPPCDTATRRAMVARTKARAERLGFVPSHRWLNIDDPTEQPDPGYQPTRDRDEFDPVVVQRIVGGDWRLPAQLAERIAVLQRWEADGLTDNEVERRTGWKISRDVRPHLPRAKAVA